MRTALTVIGGTMIAGFLGTYALLALTDRIARVRAARRAPHFNRSPR